MCRARRFTALLLAAFAAVSAAGAATASGRTYLLKPGDAFTVAGTRIFCVIQKETRSASSELVTCFLFKSPTAKPIVGSYGFSIGALGLTVLRADRPAATLSFTAHYPTSYRGVYAPDAPAPGAHTASLRRGDGVRVAHSDVGCVLIRVASLATLWCKPVLSDYAQANPLEVGFNESRVWVAHAGAIVAGAGPVTFQRNQPPR